MSNLETTFDSWWNAYGVGLPIGEFQIRATMQAAFRAGMMEQVAELALVTKERDVLREKLKATEDALFDLSYRHRHCTLKTEA